MKQLTAKQRAILLYVKSATAGNGYPPSIRELAEHFGVGGPSIHQQLGALKKKGFLTWVENQNRTLKILKEN